MKFKIPFTFSDIEILKRKSKPFIKFVRVKKSPLDDYLKATGEKIDSREYISICYRSFFIDLLSFSVIFTSLLGFLRIQLFYLYGLCVAFLISILIFYNQRNYPKIFALNKQRGMEKNLISVLQDMIVQLNSGIPIYRILTNISESDYGEVSLEFKKITKEINSGKSQIEAIEQYAKLNTSPYFKRILWQLSNGMRSGGDMAVIVEEGIRSLTEEQEIQIQNYGSQLNPLIMFYMLIAVIIPALGVTFLIILSSLLNLPATLSKLIFIAIFGLVIFLQIMFLGIIKSRRPSLL
jgi:archaeal flagellar protein FlaJ